MLNGSLSSRYSLFSIANISAAFGGGLILGKGAGVVDYPYLQGGSILAFFIGTILGLIFLQCIPTRLSKRLAQSFSISCGITSLILFYIYQNYSSNGMLTGTAGLIFFILLSVRFGFWFYSRVMRASKASSSQQSIAWVEFGYYLGMVLGLVIWKLLGIHIGLGTALMVDAIFQLIAGLLDLKSFKFAEALEKVSVSEDHIASKSSLKEYNAEWCWKLAGAVVFITIGAQVVIFNAAHYVAEAFGSYLLATFYLGVATAAFMASKFKVFICWDVNNNAATISAHKANKTTQFNFLYLITLLMSSVFFVVFQVFSNHYLMNSPLLNSILVCTLVFIAAFIYEILSITLLDRIGSEEALSGRSKMIMRTYGLMGVGAALGFWTLGVMPDHLTSSFLTQAFCLFGAIFFVLKRNFGFTGVPVVVIPA